MRIFPLAIATTLIINNRQPSNKVTSKLGFQKPFLWSAPSPILSSVVGTSSGTITKFLRRTEVDLSKFLQQNQFSIKARCYFCVFVCVRERFQERVCELLHTQYYRISLPHPSTVNWETLSDISLYQWNTAIRISIGISRILSLSIIIQAHILLQSLCNLHNLHSFLQDHQQVYAWLQKCLLN